MIHLNLDGTHYEIGRKLGTHFKQKNSNFPIRLNTQQLERGLKSLCILEKYAPELMEEIKGITDVLNCDYDLFGAWMMSMGCCLTMREHINIEVRGCTAFCFTDKGNLFYGRNNDLPSYLKNVSKSLIYKPIGKNNFILNTSSFSNGEEGMNEHGLIVAMTFVIPHKEEIKPGFNSVFLVRYLLENCSSVQEAYSKLLKLPIASSCNIILGDKKMDILVVECHPLKKNIRYPELNNIGEKYLATVNHFSSSEMKKYDRSNQNVYSSKKRYETITKNLLLANYEDPIIFSKEVLSGKLGFMCQYRKVKFQTVWSTIFDVQNHRMFLADGSPEIIDFTQYDVFGYNE